MRELGGGLLKLVNDMGGVGFAQKKKKVGGNFHRTLFKKGKMVWGWQRTW